MTVMISASVGRGGNNRRPDVETVQRLLKQRGYDPGGTDGVCGPLTIGAITACQRSFLRRPDGRVDVNGTTWRRLIGDDPGASPDAPPPPPPAPGAGARPLSYWSGNSARWPEAKKLESLNAQFRPKVVTVLTRLRSRQFRVKIFFGWRSVAVQQELVRLGRSKVRFSFHNAQFPDGTPNAYAGDIIDERWGWEPAAERNGFWEALGQEAHSLDLVWGGDWKSFKDVAHIQGRPNSELAAAKRESGL